MKFRPRFLKCILCVAAGLLPSATMAAESVAADSLLLWHDKPAEKWEEALPVGNGRLGAMIFGGTNQERLQLNEGTLWTGGPYSRTANIQLKPGVAVRLNSDLQLIQP